jgi:hypothetical protein
MFSAEKTSLLRAVLDEVCEDLPKNETSVSVRAHVACKILEAAKRDDSSVEVLKSVGRRALFEIPSMWH